MVIITWYNRLQSPYMQKSKLRHKIIEQVSTNQWTCKGKKISYFSLARNLIRHLISPNQDDLSFSTRDFFTGSSKLGKLPNPFSLAGERCPVQTSHWPFFNSNSNSLAGQRRPVQTSHCGSRIATAAAWTHEGTHLIYGFLARNPSWI